MINEAIQPRYLVCVTSDNHNKFWRVVPDQDGSDGWTAEWGRIGAQNIQSKKYYGEDTYWKKVDSKLKKGYVDQTDIMKVALTSAGKDGFKAIADKDVNSLIKALRKYANDTIKQNYTISQDAVTQEMLDRAKGLISDLDDAVDNIGKTQTSSYFNDILLKLFKTIPRKMNKVSEYLLKSDDAKEAASIVDREQKLYDVLLASFQTQQAASSNGSSNTQQQAPTQTILEKFGLKCQLVNDNATIHEIKSYLGQVASNFNRAFVVVNEKTQGKYASFMSQFPNCETKLFFHGSKNENFWSILKNSLLLNPKASVTGKMLGNGIYFAKKAIKSFNYTSLRGTSWAHGNSNIGYMAVFAVAIDPSSAYEVTTMREIDSCYGMTWDKLQKIKPGATHVFAHKGPYLREDELCIYREDQCTIRYIIELKV